MQNSFGIARNLVKIHIPGLHLRAPIQASWSGWALGIGIYASAPDDSDAQSD